MTVAYRQLRQYSNAVTDDSAINCNLQMDCMAEWVCSRQTLDYLIELALRLHSSYDDVDDDFGVP